MTTSEDLEDVPTLEIVRKLSEIGVRSTSQNSVMELAEGHHSASHVYEARSDEVTRKVTFHDNSYMVAAAEALWRRWCPNQISIGQFMDWVHEAGELESDDQDAEALDLYWKAWQFLSSQFTPEMTTSDDA